MTAGIKGVAAEAGASVGPVPDARRVGPAAGRGPSTGPVVPGIGAPFCTDDIDHAAAAVVPLTSVRQPRELLGRTAAELLLQEIEQGTGHRHRQVVVEPELVVRESSGRHRRSRAGRPGGPAGGGARTPTAARRAR